jgi:DNA-binding NarL/FixJ family response regulator
LIAARASGIVKAARMTTGAAVLIVDDERVSRETIAGMLGPDRYTLTFAIDAVSALDALKRAPPDLIICDILMPNVDGLALACEIKRHATWRLLPLMLVTALDRPDDLVRGLAAGADDFLAKPINQAVLRARVQALLRICARYQELDEAPLMAEPVWRRIDEMSQAAHLSPREHAVLRLVALGRNNVEIGLALGISKRTAKFHVANLLRKLGAESRTDLLRVLL